jgi:transposase
MAGRAERDGKLEALTASRTLNPNPAAVTDPVFVAGEFFDARDLLQVKYEMVRQVETGHVPVAAAAAAFGFSRQSVYTARAALARGGMAALLPGKPGPKGGHKLTDAVLDHLMALLDGDPDLTSKQLAAIVGEQFGVTVHPRSVERALARRRTGEDAPKSA